MNEILIGIGVAAVLTILGVLVKKTKWKGDDEIVNELKKELGKGGWKRWFRK